jgi:pSer/pThr/pTyr-binding forkhead associated (FHA) protein
VSLRLVYEDREFIISNGETAVIGSDPDATIRVAKPGISRRHAVIKHDGHAWVVQDASSRNGTYHDGARIQSLDVSAATTIFLGHPSDGVEVSLEPSETPGEALPVTDPTRVVPRTPASPPPAAQPTPAPSGSRDQELERAVLALRDMVSSIRGLTWSVWAMIAVTAVLAILTLFVGVIGQ